MVNCCDKLGETWFYARKIITFSENIIKNSHFYYITDDSFNIILCEFNVCQVIIEHCLAIKEL